jgi:ABC-type nitrate/sulfonate/bicarbonate transport system substrate-binding protein
MDRQSRLETLMTMRRRDIILACAVIGLSAAAPAAAAEKIVVGKIGAGSVVHWPIYIASEKGFFAKHGVEPDIITTSSNSAMQQQIAAGALNIGVSGGSPDPIRAVNHGSPAVILRVDSIASPYAIVSKADIKTPSDLKGRTISLDGAKGITRAYFDRIMKPTGLKEGDFDLVFQGATPARLAALQSGAADAAMLTSPFNFYAEAQGFRQLVLVNDVVKDIPFGVTAANKPWVLAHKQLTRNFIAAYGEGVAWFYDPKNRAEAIQIALRNTKMKEEDVAKTYDFFAHLGFFNRSDAVSRKHIENIMDVLIGFHDMDKRIPVDRLVASEVTKVVE